MDPLHRTLQQYWKLESFRPLQEDIIRSVLDGRDTLAILPTGGGKSLCFQLPAMMKDGICLVVSPLIALMKDQVENLRKKNITAFAIYSGMERREVINIFRLAAESNCKFLYLSPERLETALFREWLPALNINLVAVDEAHCISQWGYDFRPPYLRIAALREDLRGVPLLALTASATREVQADICEKLHMGQAAVFRQSFARENLSYSAFRVSSAANKILEILSKVPGSAIVYCKTRRRTKSLSETLVLHGITAAFYHAGLDPEERSRRQEDWKTGRTRVMVCTNAFGMGIDKPDVRVVIHADCPDSLENYYQEAGRAGRDRLKAYAVLLYRDRDLEELQRLPSIRFPSMEFIRKVYQALVNFLQVPAGTGEGSYFDFDMGTFIKNFSLDPLQTLYALKALEQEDIVSANEQVYLPSRAAFVCSKESLLDFERNNPGLVPLIQSLLRTYSGIFDLPVVIHEKAMAASLRWDYPRIVDGLKTMQARGLIEYFPQKEKPQVYFHRDRVMVQDLHINQVLYHQRKKRFEDSIRALVQYVREEKQCRAGLIHAYFGEEQSKPCGICDNCLRQKRGSLGKEEFDRIHGQILHWISTSGLHAGELENRIQGISKEKFWQVVRFLESENKLKVGADGMIVSA